MQKYIGLGEWNKNFKYIFITGFFSVLTDFLFGDELNDSFNMVKFYNSKTQIELYNHITVHEIFRYFGLFIILLIIYVIQFKKESNNHTTNENTNNNSRNPSSSIILIYNNEEKRKQESLPIISIIVIMLLWLLQFYLTRLFYRSSFRELDYWMLELFIVSKINSKIFQINIYEHQKFAIYYNFIFCTFLKLICLVISILVYEFENDSLYNENKVLIPIGLIIYILILIIRSYSISKIKYYMDLKYFSPIKILLYSSIIGIIFFSFICIIQTFMHCSILKNIKICIIQDDNKNYYIDNFLVYYETLRKAEFKDIIYEIVSLIFGDISYFFYLFFYTLVLKYLTPVHYVFSNAVYSFLIQPILLFYNRFSTGTYFSGDGKYSKFKFFQFQLNLFTDFLSLFGFLVYLEIIILKCCGLDYNVKISIRQRSIEDLNQNKYLNDDDHDENQDDNQSDNNSTRRTEMQNDN